MHFRRMDEGARRTSPGRHLGADPNERDQVVTNPFYDQTVEFCGRYDEDSLDPDYSSEPLSTFEPMMRQVLDLRGDSTPAQVDERPQLAEVPTRGRRSRAVPVTWSPRSVVARSSTSTIPSPPSIRSAVTEPA